ncbi:MAG TPA: hypothetical protein VFI02_03710 [Armatimonadota bacterium]|nr:hypothetical protein [Armatimonadota bacterium]
MTIKNYRTLSAEDFMSKLAPHTGMMNDQIIRDMRMFAAEGKDYIMIFRDVEFKVLLPDVSAYLVKVKNEFDELGVFEPAPEDIVPKEIEQKKVPGPVGTDVAARHPKQTPGSPSAAKKREIPSEFRARAKDLVKNEFLEKEPGE